MKYDVEMGSDAMMYIPSLKKFGRVIQKLLGATNVRAHTDSETER
jgi:hypothetical protein